MHTFLLKFLHFDKCPKNLYIQVSNFDNCVCSYCFRKTILKKLFLNTYRCKHEEDRNKWAHKYE